MTTFEWMPPLRDGTSNYTCNENATEYSRSTGVATVFYVAGKNCFYVTLSHQFDDLVPSNAYILNHKFPTLEAAKRAVERKVPGLVAVLKIQGITV